MNLHLNWLPKFIAGTVLAGALHVATAQASTVEHAVDVTATSGAFTGSAASTLGANDGSFIQLAFGRSITLDFGSSLTPDSQLFIYTFDDIATAFADIAISDDNVTYTTLGSTSDANGTLGAATFDVFTSFRYVRITDNGQGDPNFPGAGFDVDAVGRVMAAIPLPAGFPLLLGSLAALGWVARRRRT